MAALTNFIAFQIGWFACVLTASHHLPLAGTGAALTLVVLHLARAADPVAELKLIAAAVGAGIVLDPTLAATGLITFTSGTLIAGNFAYWMLALWMLFATTLNVSLRWLKTRTALAAALGGIGGPLAYLAGEKLGALRLERDFAVVGIAVGWALAMWLLVTLARRFDGFAIPAAARGV